MSLDAHGWTALMLAADYGHADCVELLLPGTVALFNKFNLLLDTTCKAGRREAWLGLSSPDAQVRCLLRTRTSVCVPLKQYRFHAGVRSIIQMLRF